MARCPLCNDRLERWELGYHERCGKTMGWPEPQIDWLALFEEQDNRRFVMETTMEGCRHE